MHPGSRGAPRGRLLLLLLLLRAAVVRVALLPLPQQRAPAARPPQQRSAGAHGPRVRRVVRHDPLPHLLRLKLPVGGGFIADARGCGAAGGGGARAARAPRRREVLRFRKDDVVEGHFQRARLDEPRDSVERLHRGGGVLHREREFLRSDAGARVSVSVEVVRLTDSGQHEAVRGVGGPGGGHGLPHEVVDVVGGHAVLRVLDVDGPGGPHAPRAVARARAGDEGVHLNTCVFGWREVRGRIMSCFFNTVVFSAHPNDEREGTGGA